MDYDHCVGKIVEIVQRGTDDRRALLQLGYNLGRLAELTGLGREPFWDRWKDAVAAWDVVSLRALADRLRAESTTWPNPATPVVRHPAEPASSMPRTPTS